MPDMNFMRPQGVPSLDAEAAPTVDLSYDAESAEEHLANATQLLRCASFLEGEQHRVTIEAATERIAMALRAVAERRLVPRRREMAVSA